MAKKTIKQLKLEDLINLKNHIVDIKSNLKENQKLVITLDTETTGKYYNKFQLENTSTDIVDKIIEFGAIFSIIETDYYGFQKNINIKNDFFKDSENPDLGFRLFFNPFIDNHEPFHITMPQEVYEIHNTSKEFLEATTHMTYSNEILSEPAPSLIQLNSLNIKSDLDNENEDIEYKTSYIKEISQIINLCDSLIAHNATFDVGMINEAITDHNKLNEDDKINFLNCEIIDTLKIFREEFPNSLLISMQELSEPSSISHRLDYLMYLANINERDVHGAYWDSKLLLDSYSTIMDKYLSQKFKTNIVEKQLDYLSRLDLNIKNLDDIKNEEFIKTINNKDFVNDNELKEHLIKQLDNINKGKRNEILESQIDLGINYYKVMVINLLKDNSNYKDFIDKFNKLKTKTKSSLLTDAKNTKDKELVEFFNNNKEEFSHYLTQSSFNYFDYKFNKEVIDPIIDKEYENILEKSKDLGSLNTNKSSYYTYFRTDGSIATKDNSLTTVIGSVANTKALLKSEYNKGNRDLICMDFNSMVNYTRVDGEIRKFNKLNEIKLDDDTIQKDDININYGITTLAKIEYDNQEVDFELNIFAKNDLGIREIPQILSKAYEDKKLNEEAYQDPYLNLNQIKELSLNPNLIISLGSYQGLVERVLFNNDLVDAKLKIMDEQNEELKDDNKDVLGGLFALEEENNASINLIKSKTEIRHDIIENVLKLITNNIENICMEFYPTDKFLYEYKKKILLNYPNIKEINTNPIIHLDNELEYHLIRNSKYNEKTYNLNNLNIFRNMEVIESDNITSYSMNLEPCISFPKDKVNIPGLIEDLEFIKNRRPNIFKELQELTDENGNYYDLKNNSKENVELIQKRYFIIKSYEALENRFKEKEISEEAQTYYRERFDFEMQVINNMKFDGYTLLVSDFLTTLNDYIGGLTGPGRGCLTKEALVYTYNNETLDFKQINEISIGDKVITHNNLIKEVKNTFIYDIEENLLEIETFHADKINPIILTKDHKIYCGNNVWKQAKEITTKDYLYLPIPKYKVNKINSWNMEDYSQYTKNKNYKIENDYLIYSYSQNILNEFSIKDLSKKLNVARSTINKFVKYLNKENTNITQKTIIKISNLILTKFKTLEDWLSYINNLNLKKIKKELNNSFLFRKFLGRWIGDGSIRKNLNREEVNIVFHKNDDIGINETLNFIQENNYKYKISYVKSICSITILDAYLHAFFKNIFNEYNFTSNSKYFPYFIFNLPKNEIKDIIDGYIAADGHIDKYTNRIRCSSVSKKLSFQLRKLLLQIGIPSTIKTYTRKESDHHIKLNKNNKEYLIEFPSIKTVHNVPNINKNIYEVENDYIKLRVRKINELNKVKTKVYDFTVEDDHSYTTTNYIVHNSAAGSLVSWALKITNVDPMLEYDKPEQHLLFERYLNPDRISLPDIDMDMNGVISKYELLNKIGKDVDDITIKRFVEIIEKKYIDEEFIDGKALIEDYQVALYGEDKVAKIVTRDTYQAKSAIAAVCKYLGNDFANESGFKFKGTPYIEFASRIAGEAFNKPGVGFKHVLDPNDKSYSPYFDYMYNSNYHIKKVVDLSRNLEGSIANYGVHAAGVLILDPKNNYLNNGCMIVGGTRVSLIDGKYVEDYINIKFDFLGLASLEEIDKSLQFIAKNKNIETRDKVYEFINNENILYENKQLFEKVFDKQNTKKIFQFSSDGMQDLIKKIKPENFEELVAITALYRPGPMESGMVDMYIKNKFEPEKIFEPFKELHEILKPTHYGIVYQEQVMKIVQVLGGFSLGGADLVRRAMGKKIKEELDALKGQFVDGALKKYENRYLKLETLKSYGKYHEVVSYFDGDTIQFKTLKEMADINKDVKYQYGDIVKKQGVEENPSPKLITKSLADALFENIIKFAGYGFNKSHAYAYTNVSMQMAYIKAHYPLEFFASILYNNSNDIEKLSEYIIDAKHNDIEILGIDINKSNYQFDIIDNTIIYGLSNSKGISNKDVKSIINDRNINGEYKDLSDFLERFLIKNDGSLKTLENLIYVGALDSLKIDEKSLKGFLHKDNLNKIKITEETDIYNNRVDNKKEFLSQLLSLDEKYDNNLKLSSNIQNIFNIDNVDLLPNVVQKLIANKESINKRLFYKAKKQETEMNKVELTKHNKDVEKANNYKEKFLAEVNEHYLNQIKIQQELDISLLKEGALSEEKRAFLLKLNAFLNLDKIQDKDIANIDKLNDNFNNIIYLSEKEFELTGSLENFKSNLTRDYIFKDNNLGTNLDTKLKPFEVEGDFEYRVILRDVIMGVSQKTEKPFITLELEDINNVSHRAYLSTDQVFRFKNNIEIGDPLLIDYNIKQSGSNSDVFYKKILDLKVFKENNKEWKCINVLKEPVIKISDLNLNKIKDSLKDVKYAQTEIIPIQEIKEDWNNSADGWPGLDSKQNKIVTLIMTSYRPIIAKTGKEYRIVEFKDGVSNDSLEMLFNDSLSIDDLDNNLRTPVVLELSKNQNNGYGISPAYKTGIIFLKDFNVVDIKEFDEDGQELVYSDSINPILDGQEHINIYTRGRTKLGRMLSNMYETNINVIHNNEELKFKSLESYWYFLKISMLSNKDNMEFLNYNAWEAKAIGSKIIKELSSNSDFNSNLTDEQMGIFKEKIELAFRNKVNNNIVIQKEIKENNLPFEHYYNYNGNVVLLPQYNWLVDIIEKVSKEIKDHSEKKISTLE